MRALTFFLPLLLPAAAAAQDVPASEPRETVTGDLSASSTIIAVPDLPTPQTVSTPAGSTDALGRNVAEVVREDLRRSGLFSPTTTRPITMDEVTAPQYPGWRSLGAQALVQGYVRADGGDQITVGCYVYDVGTGQELARNGYRVAPRDWRRAAHRCADSVYARLTGEGEYFDSQIVYVSETGPKANRIKRIAVMDQDGANHRFLTNGQNIVLNPRFSPDGAKVAYMSYDGNNPRIYVLDVASGAQRVVVDTPYTTFAPRFSPDGNTVLFSMAVNGNTDIYAVPVSGGQYRRLTTAPGIDVGGSFSPDGSRIVFESDRSGGQQLYVMDADGGNQRRISFGAGRHATPEWSPRGDLIAFTRTSGNFRIGVLRPDGSGERLLTDSWQDEAPTWSPNGRVIQFFRTRRGSGEAELWSVDITGVNERQLNLPLSGSDPAWGAVRK